MRYGISWTSETDQHYTVREYLEEQGVLKTYRQFTSMIVEWEAQKTENNAEKEMRGRTGNYTFGHIVSGRRRCFLYGVKNEADTDGIDSCGE